MRLGLVCRRADVFSKGRLGALLSPKVGRYNFTLLRVARRRLALNIDRYLLEPVIVILNVAVFEENDRVVFMCLHALLAESFCALVARTFYLVALMSRQLAV